MLHWGATQFDLFRSECSDILFGEKFEKGTQDNSVVVLGVLFDVTPLFCLAPVECDPVFADDIECDILWFHKTGDLDKLR